MRVTNIKQQVKNPHRYSVFLDESYSFSLSDESLLSSGLHVGQELSESAAAALQETAVEDKALAGAVAMIARRPRSVWEMTTYLQRKGHNQALIEKIITRLQEKRYLNDEAFAVAWVANRRLLKASSKRKLQQELRQKRVADDVIERCLAADTTDELAVLRELIERKRTQTRYQDRTKLMQYLSRQGFSYGDIKAALEEL